MQRASLQPQHVGDAHVRGRTEMPLCRCEHVKVMQFWDKAVSEAECEGTSRERGPLARQAASKN